MTFQTQDAEIGLDATLGASSATVRQSWTVRRTGASSKDAWFDIVYEYPRDRASVGRVSHDGKSEDVRLLTGGRRVLSLRFPARQSHPADASMSLTIEGPEGLILHEFHQRDDYHDSLGVRRRSAEHRATNAAEHRTQTIADSLGVSIQWFGRPCETGTSL